MSKEKPLKEDAPLNATGAGIAGIGTNPPGPKSILARLLRRKKKPVTEAKLTPLQKIQKGMPKNHPVNKPFVNPFKKEPPPKKMTQTELDNQSKKNSSAIQNTKLGESKSYDVVPSETHKDHWDVHTFDEHGNHEDSNKIDDYGLAQHLRSLKNKGYTDSRKLTKYNKTDNIKEGLKYTGKNKAMQRILNDVGKLGEKQKKENEANRKDPDYAKKKLAAAKVNEDFDVASDWNVDMFAGNPAFVVDSDTFHNARLGKRAPHRYSKYVGIDECGENIRQYGRENPDKPVILKDEKTGAHLVLRYGRKRRF